MCVCVCAYRINLFGTKLIFITTTVRIVCGLEVEHNEHQFSNISMSNFAAVNEN